MRRSGPVNVSINELSALLRRVFEVLYGPGNDYDDAAQIAVWLETHGLDGVELLVNALPALEHPPSAAPPSLASDSPGRVIVDANGGSLFGIAGPVGDLAIAAALTGAFGRVSIIGASHRDAIVATVARCSRRDLAALAVWVGRRGSRLYLAETQPGRLPTYRYANGAFERIAGTVELICARDAGFPRRWLTQHDPGLPASWTVSLSATDLADCFDRRLDAGMRIPDAHYAALCEVADRVLVTASETSRLGAGEPTSGSQEHADHPR